VLESSFWGLGDGFCTELFLYDSYLVIMYIMCTTENKLIDHVPFMFSGSRQNSDTINTQCSSNLFKVIEINWERVQNIAKILVCGVDGREGWQRK